MKHPSQMICRIKAQAHLHLATLCLGLITWAHHAAEAQVSNRSTPPSLKAEGWKPIFDGKTLNGWKITQFAGHAEVRAKEGQLEIDQGLALSGVQYTNTLPKVDYELSLKAMKVEGSDFFCGLTLPYKEAHCTFVVGGWGGGVVGLSSIDGMDASENDTTQFKGFDDGVWYHIRLRMRKERIEAWIDDECYVNLETEGRRIDMRFGEIELSKPFGLATWMTSAAYKDIQIRPLTP